MKTRTGIKACQAARFSAYAILAILTLFFSMATEASAHARLKRASPPVGGAVSVDKAPSELRIWFSERVEPSLSEIQVVNAAGARFDNGGLRLDDTDPTELHLALQPLLPGRYRVIWRAVSVDTHKTNGTFPFRVRPKGRPGLTYH
jgi:methionine-rich copper-binding protein CopC